MAEEEYEDDELDTDDEGEETEPVAVATASKPAKGNASANGKAKAAAPAKGKAPAKAAKPAPAKEEKEFIHLDADEARQVARLFDKLRDATRITILHALAQSGEVNVGDLCGICGQSQPAVSHHLSKMKESSTVKDRREGKSVYYSLGATGKVLNKALQAVLKSVQEA